MGQGLTRVAMLQVRRARPMAGIDLLGSERLHACRVRDGSERFDGRAGLRYLERRRREQPRRVVVIRHPPAMPRAHTAPIFSSFRRSEKRKPG